MEGVERAGALSSRADWTLICEAGPMQLTDATSAELVATTLTGVGGWTPLDAAVIELEVHHRPKHWRTPANYRCAGCGERRLSMGLIRIVSLFMRNTTNKAKNSAAWLSCWMSCNVLQGVA